jgi:prepilin-type N-terminal cleavage/methylation domain-containing protein
MWSRARRTRRGRRGFTLIELLTVIAIIAILAGLLFPVFNAVRENARKGACTTNLHHIIQMMNVYKEDWRAYPDALYGVEYGAGQNAPAMPFQLRLGGPDYINNLNTFQCPNHPTSLKNPPASDPQTITPINRMTGQPYVDAFGRPVLFNVRDSYDLQFRPPSNPSANNAELHYTRKWTPGAASNADDPRQLIYKQPSDSTVVTWCLYHSDLDQQGNPRQGRIALVAFLNGRVQTLPAEKVANWPGTDNKYPWQVDPKQ